MTDKTTRHTRVQFSELEDALNFVSQMYVSAAAYIDTQTGKIYWVSRELADNNEEIPEDIETSERYICVPTKHDLDLGRNLVFDFVDEVCPDAYVQVSGFFRRKGAYQRFKDFLDRHDLLDTWYAFEAERTKRALLAWCEEQDITVADD